jgi:predicted RNase H-like HicB family nuclease
MPTYSEVVQALEDLSADEQQTLFNLLSQRLADHRRDEIVREVNAACQDHAQGVSHAMHPSEIMDLIDINVFYDIVLSWSDEDAAYIAEVPELPGCAADGSTYQEALTNVELAIREWIHTARILGRPVP